MPFIFWKSYSSLTGFCWKYSVFYMEWLPFWPSQPTFMVKTVLYPMAKLIGRILMASKDLYTWLRLSVWMEIRWNLGLFKNDHSSKERPQWKQVLHLTDENYSKLKHNTIKRKQLINIGRYQLLRFYK